MKEAHQSQGTMNYMIPFHKMLVEVGEPLLCAKSKEMNWRQWPRGLRPEGQPSVSSCVQILILHLAAKERRSLQGRESAFLAPSQGERGRWAGLSPLRVLQPHTEDERATHS